MLTEGRIWYLGDDLSATDLVPARYDKASMSGDWATCARGFLEDVAPDIGARIEPGDILLTGRNFGRGHAHYHGGAVRACLALGIRAVFPVSADALFLRRAVDIGLLLWSLPELEGIASTGDILRVDLAEGAATNRSTDERRTFEPLAPELLDLLAAGGSDRWAMSYAAKNRAVVSSSS